jgi:signal peptide peptidase SppA
MGRPRVYSTAAEKQQAYRDRNGGSMTSYPQIRRALAGKLWYVHEQKMNEMLAFLEVKLAGGSSAPEVIKSIRATNQASASRAQRTSKSGGAVGVIPVYGMLLHRQTMDISGGSSGMSTNVLSAALRQMVDDPGVGSIVLDIDSPGGEVDGIDELASEIYAARQKKKITAVSNCLCASAAYYLASQCSEIVVSPSSQTGSIGVYTMAEDASAMYDAMGIKLELIAFGENKAEGNNLGPLTDSARAHLQEMVDTYGNAFEKAVARGRGIKQDVVHSRFGQGRIFDARQAVRIGMADRVGTLADAVATSAGGRQARISATRHQVAIAGASAPARKLEFARMRHELAMAAMDGTGTIPAPKKRTKRSDVGPDDGCGCDCDPCGDGDCDGCDCDDCACEGCACDAATAAAKKRAASFERMRHQLAAAGA